MAKITYADKSAINQNTQIPDVNKVNASDMNQIKATVNANDDKVGELSSLNTTNKSSIVAAVNEVNSKSGIIKDNLWSGSKSTTGNITLNHSWTDYDWIAIVGAAPNAECEEIFLVSTIGLALNKEINISVFQTANVYASATLKFTANTTLNIEKFSTTSSWGNFWVKRVDGIKF